MPLYRHQQNMTPRSGMPHLGGMGRAHGGAEAWLSMAKISGKGGACCHASFSDLAVAEVTASEPENATASGWYRTGIVTNALVVVKNGPDVRAIMAAHTISVPVSVTACTRCSKFNSGYAFPTWRASALNQPTCAPGILFRRYRRRDAAASDSIPLPRR